MIRGVIFDLDGTLVTLQVDGAELREATLAELAKSGFDTRDISRGGTVQDILDQAKAGWRAGDGDFEEVKRRIYLALDALEMKWILGARPLPAVAPILSKLKRSSYLLATLTNSGRPAARYALGKFGLAGYLDYVFTRDDVPAMKPHPDGMLFATEAMGVAREDVLYVGDSVIDIRAARGAGIKIASIATGRYGLDDLKKGGPDFAMSSLGELEAVLAL